MIKNKIMESIFNYFRGLLDGIWERRMLAIWSFMLEFIFKLQGQIWDLKSVQDLKWITTFEVFLEVLNWKFYTFYVHCELQFIEWFSFQFYFLFLDFFFISLYNWFTSSVDFVLFVIRTYILALVFSSVEVCGNHDFVNLEF